MSSASDNVTLDSVKAYLRLDGDADDGLLAELIADSREVFKEHTGNDPLDPAFAGRGRRARLVMVASWYEDPEGGRPFPEGLKYLLHLSWSPSVA